MIKPPSLQNDYTLCSEYDDALDLPEVPKLGDDASAEDRATAKKLSDEREQKLKTARDHGSWDSLVKQGRTAVRFHFRQLGRSAIHWWLAEIERGNLSNVESSELLFRLALKSVDGVTFPVPLKHDNGKFPMLSVASMDAVYAIDGNSGVGLMIVGELTYLVSERARGLRPLS